VNRAGIVILFAAVSLPCEAVGAPELVLQEGARLTATTSSGSISILAGRGVARTYRWNNCSLQSRMLPRASRWFGSLGVYDPSPGSVGPALFSRGCKGISRTVVQEAQIHFSDPSAAEKWLARYAAIGSTVWSNDGLVVQWFLSPGREQLNADVWQVCVLNRQPTELAGATDSALQFVGPVVSGAARRACATVGMDVVQETQKAWDEHWRSVDEWKTRTRR